MHLCKMARFCALCTFLRFFVRFCAFSPAKMWETDFYTPPVLGGAANFDFSALAVYKIQGP